VTGVADRTAMDGAFEISIVKKSLDGGDSPDDVLVLEEVFETVLKLNLDVSPVDEAESSAISSMHSFLTTRMSWGVAVILSSDLSRLRFAFSVTDKGDGDIWRGLTT